MIQIEYHLVNNTANQRNSNQVNCTKKIAKTGNYSIIKLSMDGTSEVYKNVVTCAKMNNDFISDGAKVASLSV